MAWTVSIDSSRRGLTSKRPSARSKTATVRPSPAVDDDAGVAVVEPQRVVVLGDEQWSADVPRAAVAVAGDRGGEPGFDLTRSTRRRRRGRGGGRRGRASRGGRRARRGRRRRVAASVIRRPASTTASRTGWSAAVTSSVGDVDVDPANVVVAGAEHVDRGVVVAALDRRGQLGDRAAEAVDAAKHDDPFVGSATDDVAEHGAGLDRGELVGVADEDQPGVGPDGVDELGHERERHHRGLVDHDDVVRAAGCPGRDGSGCGCPGASRAGGGASNPRAPASAPVPPR